MKRWAGQETGIERYAPAVRVRHVDRHRRQGPVPNRQFDLDSLVADLALVADDLIVGSRLASASIALRSIRRERLNPLPWIVATFGIDGLGTYSTGRFNS